MNLETVTKTPWQFWAIAIVGLVWNLGGVVSYTMTKLGNLDGLNMPAEQIEYYMNFPSWATAFWALGVWGAFIGSILLLLRKSLAVSAFGISVVGLVGTTVFQWVVSDMPASLSTPGQMAFAALIWATTLFLLWYARKKASEGVLT